MLARILFPTDLSAYTNAVLVCLTDLKAAGVAEVVVRFSRQAVLVIRPQQEER
jgi:hypothetical protein